MKAIILGSQRGIRHLDSTRSYPTALAKDQRGQRVLDWILTALSQSGIKDIVFIGGYHIQKVVRLYPQLRFYYNPAWQEVGELQALGTAIHELDGPCILIRADTVFDSDIVRALLEPKADVVISSQNHIPLIESISDDEFLGPIAISTLAANKLKDRIEQWHQNLDSGTEHQFLMPLLSELDVSTRIIDIGSSWMFIDDVNSLSRFVFGTKAQTLERLQPVVTKAQILDQIRFTQEEWQDHAKEIIERIQKKFSAKYLVVRSSALSEDSWNESQAGKFHSELGVDATNADTIYRAIKSVILSFSEKDTLHQQNEIFVQPHLDKVILSGVAFTRYPETGAPYIIINYDNTKRTDTVTSGQGDDLHTAIIYKYSQPPVDCNPYILHLLEVVTELEELSGHDSLDIEFAFDETGECWIFQVRVLVKKRQAFDLTDEDIAEELSILREYITEVMQPRPHLHGNTTILANMPDWNPAEIIGISPSPLALSLYQYLITDRTWGQARSMSLYRDTVPEPLVISLAGHPYVDTRASLNSFLPHTLRADLGAKLVNHYLNRLKSHPEFHDKLEFEIALTCLNFSFEREKQRLLEYGFTHKEVEEIRLALLTLTDDIIAGRVATIEEQTRLVTQLTQRRKETLAAKHSSSFSLVRTIDFLLDDCIRLGTLPFSIVARYAFIATSFLRSLEKHGIFSAKEIDQFLYGIPTVATEIVQDLQQLSIGALAQSKFLSQYGHLRPGTYEITSPSYSEAPELYLSNLDILTLNQDTQLNLERATALFNSKSSQIATLIDNFGFTFSVEDLMNFIFLSIPAREKLKFEYTKNLSAVLSLIAEFGELYSLSRDDMSYLPIKRLLTIATNSPSSVLSKELSREISLNRKRYLLHKAIKLSHMLSSPKDIDYFELLKWQPNFVTSNCIVGSVVNINEIELMEDIRGKIALIESADPGYDWLFGCGISGLITKYGGVASHMAIRSAELGIPAAIGCGELIYGQTLAAQVVELDCAGHLIRVIQ